MHPDIRASDADRERAADALRRHCTEGRLTLDELQDRLGAVYASRTVGQLADVMHDLPAIPPPPPVPLPEPRRRNPLVDHVATYITVNLFLIVVWLGTGAGYFWPGWIIFWWGLGLAAHAARQLGPPRRRAGPRRN